MRKRLTGVMALAMLLIGGLIAPVSADNHDNNDKGTEVCPDGIDGWVKIDKSSGSATGDWGTFSYSGKVLTYEVNEGGILELCYKSGAGVNDGNAVYPNALTGPTSGTITIEQEYSHVSWRVTYDAPVVVVDYCDPSQRPAGMSIAQWLPADYVAADCFTVDVAPSCGSFTATVTEAPVGYDYRFRWVEGTTKATNPDTDGADNAMSATFAEDYNGGSVDITYYIVGPEKDYLVGFNDAFPNWWDGGKTISVNTNCITDPGPGVTIPSLPVVEEVIVEVEVPVEVEVLPEVLEAEPEVIEEAEPVVEEAEPEVVEEVVEVRGVTATRAVPTGIDAGTGGYLPGSTPTAVLVLLMLGGLALTGGATASLVRRRG